MTATKTVQELAAEMAAQFETRKCDDGTEYVCLKDDAPQEGNWMNDVCREAHGDMFPDDWRYSIIRDAVDWIAENGAGEDDPAEFADSTTEVYTAKLADWLGSHSDRVGYCDEAAQEFGSSDSMFETMQRGQYMEREEVFHYVVEALEKIADED